MDMPLVLPLMKYFIIYFSIFFIVLLLALLLFRRRLSWRVWLGVLPLPLSILMYLGSYVLLNFVGRMQVEKQIEKMRQAGIPTDFKEFIPDSIDFPDNAAILYEEIFRTATPFFEEPEKLTDENKASFNVGTWKDSDRAAFTKLLASEESAKIFKLTAEGVSKPFAAYHRHYNGILTSLPEASSQRALFRYFSLAASYYGNHGDLKKAYSIINNGFKIVKQLEREPVLLSYLVNVASMAINVDAMNTLMKQYGIDDNDAGILLKSLNAIDFKKAGIYTQEGEMNLVGGDVMNILKGDYSLLGDGEIYKYASWMMQLVPYQYSDYSRYLTYMQKEVELVKAPYRTIEKNDDRKTGKFLKSFNNKFLAIFLGTCAPVNLNKHTARIQADTDAAKLMLALHIYKNDHGQFPETLDVLAPEILKEIPVEPYSGKPFEYKKDDNYFTLSSTWLAEKGKFNKKSKFLKKNGKTVVY